MCQVFNLAIEFFVIISLKETNEKALVIQIIKTFNLVRSIQDLSLSIKI